MNIFLYEFLEDMVDVGLKTWAKLLLVFVVLAYGIQQTSFAWLAWVGWLLAANILVAIGVTIWWDVKGRAEYGY